MNLFILLFSIDLIVTEGNHHYDAFTATTSPLDAMNILLRELRREVGDIRKELRSKMEVMKYELSCEIRNLKDELAKEQEDKNGEHNNKVTEEFESIKKQLKRGFRRTVDMGDEIKNELRSQKAELYAVRNSVYDSREEIINKGNHVLRNIQNGNESLTCHMLDVRKKLMKVNNHLSIISQRQDRLSDAIKSRTHVRDFVPIPPEEIFQELTTQDSMEILNLSQDHLKHPLPGCTINPLETQETLETFGKEYYNLNLNITKDSAAAKEEDGKDEDGFRRPTAINRLFPTMPENCNDVEKKTYLEYPPMPRDCKDVYELGFMETGVYRIQPPGLSTREVYCDHDTEGGGWTVFTSRRKSARHISFNRSWHEYEVGFGEPNKEYWLGK